MRIELCTRSGNIFLHSENAEDEAELYEFWAENKPYKDDFKMEDIWSKQESRESGYSESEAHVTLNISCEGG
jgi:hypothetical protein